MTQTPPDAPVTVIPGPDSPPGAAPPPPAAGTPLVPASGALADVLIALPGAVGTLQGRVDGLSDLVQSSMTEIRAALAGVTEREARMQARVQRMAMLIPAIRRATATMQQTLDENTQMHRAELRANREQADHAQRTAQQALESSAALGVKLDSLAAKVDLLRASEAHAEGVATGRKNLLVSMREHAALVASIVMLFGTAGGVVAWEIRQVERAMDTLSQKTTASVQRVAAQAAQTTAEACCEAPAAAGETVGEEQAP